MEKNMTSLWEVRCEFSNVFMLAHGTECTLEIRAESEPEAINKAQLKMCEGLGISTIMHRAVKVLSLKQLI
ncbi:hypothetical protein KKD81_00500 [Patescibacteria group bacterium]|nr:hypothetical protein [Patescibacteria group bacterium]